MDGKNKTLTWVGCFCSTILVGTICTLFYFQVSSHVDKVESQVTTFETAVEGNKLFDMQAVGTILTLQYYNLFLTNVPFRTFVDFNFFHVRENKKTRFYEKSPLASVPCEQTTHYRDDLNLKASSECLQFDKRIEIGEEKQMGIKSYIEVEINPCRSGCFGYPGDPFYIPTIKNFLGISFFYVSFLNSKSDFKSYEQPFGLG